MKLPKFKEAGVSVTPAAGGVPVPVSVTVCGLLESLSAMLSVADSLFVVDGVNVTLIVQLPPDARVAGAVPQVSVSAKSAGFVPVKLMVMPVRVLLVASVSVTGCDGLVVPLG